MRNGVVAIAMPFDWRSGVISNGDLYEDGGADLIRLQATMDEETWVYTYSPGDEADMLNVLARHVKQGKLHPVTGYVLAEMVAEGDGPPDIA